MYQSFYDMDCDPFIKGIDIDKLFESIDYKEATARLNHLLKIKGLGVITGTSGTGKTNTIRAFIDSLNPQIYKVVYIQLSTVTVVEFYKELTTKLGLEPLFRKNAMFNQIQDRIKSLYKDKRMTTVIICDEAQYLNTSILNDLKMLLNFEVDSKDYAALVLVGQPVLNLTLSKQIHDALSQRLVINYDFQGLSEEEIKEYIKTRFELAKVIPAPFADNAIQAIGAASQGSIRRLNTLITTSLRIGAKTKTRVIDTEIVMQAQNEITLA